MHVLGAVDAGGDWGRMSPSWTDKVGFVVMEGERTPSTLPCAKRVSADVPVPKVPKTPKEVGSDADPAEPRGSAASVAWLKR